MGFEDSKGIFAKAVPLFRAEGVKRDPRGTIMAATGDPAG